MQEGNNIISLSDAEFLSFLYSEREREESLNSYQGWNAWAVVGALITVSYAAYGVLVAHNSEIDKIRTFYLLSYYLGSIFCFWNSVLFVLSFIGRKRATDYKKLKCLKDVAPIPYLIVITVCSLVMAMGSVVINVVNEPNWNTASISWIALAICHLLICVNLYINRNAIVWAIKEDFWFARTWVMVLAGLFVSMLFWLIWNWSRENIIGPFLGTAEFELATYYTAIVMLVYLLLKIKMANRKSSTIDVLIDEYVYKDKSKEDVYRQLRANQMGYSILEACSQELYALKKYSDTFEQQKEKLDEVKNSFINRTIDVKNLEEQFRELEKSLNYNEEWAKRIDALYVKVAEIDKNIPQLRSEDEFVNMLKIVGHLTNKGREMNDKIKSVIEEIQKFMDGMRNAR